MPPSPADRPARRARRPLPSVSIVIPVRDSAGLPPMLRGLPVVDEVIVVTADPGEDTAVLAACPDALLVHQTRSGVGNALACGFATATGDVVVTLDGDGATDPGELPRYVAALVAGADIAFGSRYRRGGRDLTAGRFRRGLNLALVWLINMLYGVHRTDPGFGYCAFWRDAIAGLGLPDPSPAAPAAWGDGPEIQALLTVRTAARGLTVTEVPGVAYPRMRRTARAGHTTLAHWLRVLAAEFRGRAPRPPRHSLTTIGPRGRAGRPSPARPAAPAGSAVPFDQPRTRGSLAAVPRPRADRPSTTGSRKAQLGKAQPGKAQPGKAQPGKAQPGKAQPGKSRGGKVESAEAQPRIARFGKASSGETRFGVSEPGADQPGAVQPPVAQPGKADPRIARSGPIHPGIAQVKGNRLGKDQPGTGRRALPSRRLPLSGRRIPAEAPAATANPGTSAGPGATGNPGTGATLGPTADPGTGASLAPTAAADAGLSASESPGATKPARTGHSPTGESPTTGPIWGPPRRRPDASVAHLWLAEFPDPLGRAVGHAHPATTPPADLAQRAIPQSRSGELAIPQPRSGEIAEAGGRRLADPTPELGGPSQPAGYDNSAPPIHSDTIDPATGRPQHNPTPELGGPSQPAGYDTFAPPIHSDEPVAEPPREVGTKRRRLEAYRQRPDLRVINGEGTGTGRTRSGRLRAVPRETTGGIG